MRFRAGCLGVVVYVYLLWVFGVQCRWVWVGFSWGLCLLVSFAVLAGWCTRGVWGLWFLWVGTGDLGFFVLLLDLIGGFVGGYLFD